MKDQIYVAWRSPDDASWQPVGLLSIDDDIYSFVYTKGSLKSDFVRFHRMEKGKQYSSSKLFTLFTNRIISNRRPDYENYLRWLELDDNDLNKLKMLVLTEGIKATDNLEFFQRPIPNNKNEFEVVFALHGLQHFPKHVINRVNDLREGERLFLNPDPQNEYDPDAVLIRTGDPIYSIGYCPRYLSPDFELLLSMNNVDDVKLTVKRINPDAPLNLRLLCKIVTPWPDGFRACDRDEFQPLVDEDGILNINENAEIPIIPLGISAQSNEDFSGRTINAISNDSKSQKVRSIASSKDNYKKGGNMIMKNYRYGRRSELKVAKSLRGKGASVKVSPGSRGAADLKAAFSPAKKWNVQVKSSRSNPAASPSKRDLGRLKQSASRSKATPVIAKVTPKGTVYKSARTGRTLKP